MTEPFRLQMPMGVSTAGPAVNPEEAYLKSVIAIPELLHRIHGELSEIAGYLSVIALYAEKKGLAEGVLHNDDLEVEGGK